MSKKICPIIYNIVFEHRVALIYHIFHTVYDDDDDDDDDKYIRNVQLKKI
jgi:hypothetical protein